MVVDKEFVRKLKVFELNSYEAKLWAALLSRGISTAGELSEISNVPRSRTYDVLESLEKKGFVVMKLGKPIRYIALPPEEVIERMKKRTQDEAERRTKLLGELKGSDLLDELTLLHKQGVELVDPTDLSGAVRGRENLYDQLEAVIRSAEERITLVTTPEGIVRKLRLLKRAFKKMQERNIKVRIAVNNPELALPALKELSKWAEIRVTDSRARFCIVDGKQIVFMVLNDEDVHPNYDVGIWVNTPYFAHALESLFELAWRKMEPVKLSPPPVKRVK